MTLRRIVLFTILTTSIGLVAVLVINLRAILLPHFRQEESTTVELNIQRIQSVLETYYYDLERSAVRYAQAPEIAAYLQQPGSPLDAAVLHNLGLDLAALVDLQGQVVSGSLFDLAGSSYQPLPPDLLANLAEGYHSYISPDGTQLRTGVLAVGSVPMTVVSLPVQPAGEAVAGVLLVGRYLDEGALSRISQVLQAPLTFELLAGKELSPGAEAARQQLASGDPFFVEPADDVTSVVYVLLPDLFGQPLYIMHMEQARTLYRNGQIVVNYLVVALGMAGVTFSVITFLVLEVLVIARLTRLGKEVNQIGASGDISRQVTLTRHDELTQLAGNINQMLAALLQAQQQRQGLEDALRQRVAELGALFEVSQTFLSHLSVPAILANICRMAVERFGVDQAWVGQLGRDNQLRPAAAFGIPLAELPDLPVPWQLAGTETPAAQVARRGGEMILNRMPGEGETSPAAAAFALTSSQEPVLVLALSSRSGVSMRADNLPLLQAFTNLARIALQNALLFEQVYTGRERLQTLSRQLVEIQEEERRRIALELHDEIGQVLTGLKLLLEPHQPSGESVDMKRLEGARQLVNDLIGRVRQLSLDLRPPMLDDLGLLPALVWLFERYTHQTGIEVSFQNSLIENQRLRPELETAAFRIIQEALTNVARYAGVSRVVVQVWQKEDTLQLQVEDDGAGFDFDQVQAAGKGRGLSGMRERAVAVGGQVVVDAAPGKGACIIVDLPLRGVLERRESDRHHPSGR